MRKVIHKMIETVDKIRTFFIKPSVLGSKIYLNPKKIESSKRDKSILGSKAYPKILIDEKDEQIK